MFSSFVHLNNHNSDSIASWRVAERQQMSLACICKKYFFDILRVFFMFSTIHSSSIDRCDLLTWFAKKASFSLQNFLNSWVSDFLEFHEFYVKSAKFMWKWRIWLKFIVFVPRLKTLWIPNENGAILGSKSPFWWFSSIFTKLRTVRKISTYSDFYHS